ncbi:flagellar hook-basal body complex protein FliE [Phreatobacter oligotrophus]|jgi:flagellar hook-basal body complex protein FliE|uniref:Flagellar hook-basal body complex protein FliE n=1 Tax=Phreatobacter oligotrophus TaxID=1122261 RepID=A0A2T4YZE0_9HYPH|nr:flagellar hook-basal body complex protein FliE [Phreatobacter oligotrophus]PTM52269.1 flagellar hook-basal body complex protein FliE [Phreatobacter oligotrophus]
MSSSSIAANAYATAARLFAPNTSATRPTGQGGSFGDLLRGAVQNLDQTARQTDQRTAAMAAGRADLIDVVTAVAETEVAVEALVSVRDKVVQAYEEIMRMQI